MRTPRSGARGRAARRCPAASSRAPARNASGGSVASRCGVGRPARRCSATCTASMDASTCGSRRPRELSPSSASSSWKLAQVVLPQRQVVDEVARAVAVSRVHPRQHGGGVALEFEHPVAQPGEFGGGHGIGARGRQGAPLCHGTMVQASVRIQLALREASEAGCRPMGSSRRVGVSAIVLRVMVIVVVLVVCAWDVFVHPADHPSRRLVPCEWALRFLLGGRLAISSFRPNAFFTPG